MRFEEAYRDFIAARVEGGTKASAERIRGGLQHAEETFLRNVWWPAFHNFDNLHPEYEVRDFKEGRRYIDFAYIHPHFQIAIEIDGYGPHFKDTTSEQFCDGNMRQNHLVIDGWYVLRFGYPDVETHARLCQQTVQQLLGSLMIREKTPIDVMSYLDGEIFRLACGMLRAITIDDIVAKLPMSRRTAQRHLRKLVLAGHLQPMSGTERIHAYTVHPKHANSQLRIR